MSATGADPIDHSSIGRVAAVRLVRRRTGADLRTAVRVVDLLAADRRSLV